MVGEMRHTAATAAMANRAAPSTMSFRRALIERPASSVKGMPDIVLHSTTASQSG